MWRTWPSSTWRQACSRTSRTSASSALPANWCWDASLEIMRKLDPKRELPKNFSGGKDSNVILPATKAEKLLQELGRPGWTSLEDSIAANVKDA